MITSRQRLDRLSERIGKHVENFVHFDVTDSTHSLARRIIAEVDSENQKLGATLILADSQTKGEGRGDATWVSPPGGLYLSWLRSGVKADTITRLPMLAAVAAAAALNRVGIRDASIKWPNDLVVKGRKIAGILVFARHGALSWVAVGFGVNLESAPILDEGNVLLATAVAEEIGTGNIDEWYEEIVCGFIDELVRSMEYPKPAIERWKELLIQKPGDTVTIRLASGNVTSGTLLKLTEEGFLMIRENGKERVITGGDVIES